MTQEELIRRQERAEREVLVISPTADGYKVHAPTDSRRTYLVFEMGERLMCTCPDFERHAEDPEWRCKHVLAVEKHVRKATPTEEPRKPKEEPATPMPPAAPTQIFLKRSISPDGRIDSLSVGVSWPVDDVPAGEMKTKIEKVLKLQADVVSRFLGNDKKPEEPRAEIASSQAAPARMIGVGGMEGRWGRRLFLTFETAGRTVRYFGTQKQLAAAIAEAGYPNIQGDIAEGLDLGLPCRVVTKPTEDGRYLNVEQVLPPESGRTKR